MTEMRTRPINTKFGKLYATSWWRNGELIPDERVRFFDEYDRLLDYYENDTILEWCEAEGHTPEHWIEEYCKVIEEKETIEDLLEYMCVEYDYCGTSKVEAIKALANGDPEDAATITDYELQTNEWVIIIGEYYIVMREY